MAGFSATARVCGEGVCCGSRDEKFRIGDDEVQKRAPDAKEVLLRVCELRLAQAREQAGVVLGEERARLIPEGFSEQEIRGSALSKRATGRVRTLETIQRRIANEPLESTWKLFAPQLLQS
jgi:hypothetical protein